MLRSATGLLTLLDANTSTPKVFWRGQPFAVTNITVVGHIAMFRVSRGLHSPELLADLAANGVKVKEVTV
jgi:hypothetical protein